MSNMDIALAVLGLAVFLHLWRNHWFSGVFGDWSKATNEYHVFEIMLFATVVGIAVATDTLNYPMFRGYWILLDAVTEALATAFLAWIFVVGMGALILFAWAVLELLMGIKNGSLWLYGYAKKRFA